MSQLAPDAPTFKVTDSWYRRLYRRVEALASTPHALAAFVVVSVIDASVFPIPPFALMVPMVVAQPRRWWSLAIWGTTASLVGGLIGYFLGMLIHSGVATVFNIDLNARVDRFGIHSTLGQLLGDNFWILALLCSILPTPFKVVAIGSGLVLVPLPRFLLAATLGRLTRFLLVGSAMALIGPRARKWLRV